MTVTADTTTLAFQNLSAGANNDCPDPMAPKGVIAMTIAPPTGTNPFLTVCTGRPDLLPGGLDIGSQVDQVQLIDLDATSGGCSFSIDSSVAPTGTMSAVGLCDAGSAHAGFALVADATVTLSRKCGVTIDQVTATLSGTIAIAGP